MAPPRTRSESPVGRVAAGPASGVRLRLARLAGGLSQEQLAARAGVSRQAVAAIEGGRSDPSLRVALDLAQALRRSVEDLFADPAVLSPTPALLVCPAGSASPAAGVRVDLAEVGERRVAFALSGDQSLRPGFVPSSGRLAATDGAGESGRDAPDGPDATDAPGVAGVAGVAGGVAGREPVLVEAGPPGQPAVVVAGCDPALGLLAGPLAEIAPPYRLAWWPCNSATALGLAAAGLVHAAGVHLPEDGPGIASLASAELRRAGAEVIGFGAWQEGLTVGPAAAKGGLDLGGIAERGLRLVNRELGSEARQLLDAELARAGLGGDDLVGYASEVRAHLLVASAVAAGLGEAGVTMEPAARAYGLAFTPLARETFQLVVPTATLHTPAVQALLHVLSAPTLRLELSRLPAYDATSCGQAVCTLSG